MALNVDRLLWKLVPATKEVDVNRRELASLFGGMVALTANTGTVFANSDGILREAEIALNHWTDALFSGDPEKVASILAPEFQILRGNGEGFSKDDYLRNLPVQNKKIVWSNLVATGNAQLLVLRYRAEVDQVIDGKATVGEAPRLSVFRHDDNIWLMVAHANFSIQS